MNYFTVNKEGAEEKSYVFKSTAQNVSLFFNYHFLANHPYIHIYETALV